LTVVSAVVRSYPIHGGGSCALLCPLIDIVPPQHSRSLDVGGRPSLPHTRGTFRSAECAVRWRVSMAAT